MYLILEISFA